MLPSLLCFVTCAGESDVTEAVIEESEAEGRAAREFLEAVRQSFPQVIQVAASFIRYQLTLMITGCISRLWKSSERQFH